MKAALLVQLARPEAQVVRLATDCMSELCDQVELLEENADRPARAASELDLFRDISDDLRLRISSTRNAQVGICTLRNY